MLKNKKILFIVPYPLAEAPSQRFRFEQYFDRLRELEFQFDVQSFIDEQTWRILYKPGFFVSKAMGILKGFLRRCWVLFRVFGYDFVFIHREASPVGPPFFEWIIGKVLGKKIIYDFDDAIWLPNTSDHNKIAASFKFHQKTKNICSWSYKVSCGNQYLANYALKFNRHVVVNPTTIDTVNLHNQTIDYSADRIAIGWTGTHSTIQYLDAIIDILAELEQQYQFEFIVISNRQPDFKLKSLRFIPWSKDTEIDDLCKMNIGIMPLEEDQWAEGKCGFKGLQYMSLGIPTIMSPVGVNREIIKDGQNGFLAKSKQEWKEKLERLIQDKSLRKQLGAAGKETILKRYSVLSNQDNFISLFS